MTKLRKQLEYCQYQINWLMSEKKTKTNNQIYMKNVTKSVTHSQMITEISSASVNKGPFQKKKNSNVGTAKKCENFAPDSYSQNLRQSKSKIRKKDKSSERNITKDSLHVLSKTPLNNDKVSHEKNLRSSFNGPSVNLIRDNFYYGELKHKFAEDRDYEMVGRHTLDSPKFIAKDIKDHKFYNKTIKSRKYINKISNSENNSFNRRVRFTNHLPYEVEKLEEVHKRKKIVKNNSTDRQNEKKRYQI